jgi:hypothetical protein
MAFVLLMSGLPACLAQSWPFAGQKYPDRQAAEAAAAAFFERVRTGIQPREAPLAGTVKIIVPSKEFWEKIFRRRYAQLYDRFSEQQRGFLIGVGYDEHRSIVDCVRRRNVFERVDVEEIPGTAESGHVNPVPGEVVIYYYAADKNTRGWYYRSDKTTLTPLNYDTGNPDPAGRMKYMVDSIEALAAGERP